MISLITQVNKRMNLARIIGDDMYYGAPDYYREHDMSREDVVNQVLWTLDTLQEKGYIKL
ncbi:MAG TPA: hypothetical protein PLU21_01015 [Candidatus Saccharibacteria bacterium]|nr:hypothetical protein [Candidatus Saccharibacteria bacterium]